MTDSYGFDGLYPEQKIDSKLFFAASYEDKVKEQTEVLPKPKSKTAEYKKISPIPPT